MLRLTAHGFTLQELLIMAAINQIHVATVNPQPQRTPDRAKLAVLKGR